MKVNTWVTATGNKIELNTEHITKELIFKDDFGVDHFRDVDKIVIKKVVINGKLYENRYGQQYRDTFQGSRVIRVGDGEVNGEKRKIMIALPQTVEMDVWGAWDDREKKRNELRREEATAAKQELDRNIANGYCVKCESYCWGDCDAN